ncbi:Amidase [Penicillium italicum]|uniref:Amidase n=1 Tax=Penicillium italicum TaxID=40296 RepID=A0A0A2KR04_PENIT|nr:Amidase [Penicillium italicum]
MSVAQNSKIAFDLVAASASQIQRLLSEGTLTTVHLVEQCLSQIEKLDRQELSLNAMISIVPRPQLLKRAECLDKERQAGQLRGPLHGIPIVLKDIINTESDFELPTTAGSFALKGAENAGNALLVEKLLEKGLIILGKTNLSEFGACKGEKGIGGLSAIGGQVQSVYVEGGVQSGDEPFAPTNPGGSSSGSAVAVAAGYAPLAIGGEADGSIGTPASRSSLFALKCTPQTISSSGILLITPTFESIGGMAKTAADLADLIAVILEASNIPRNLPETLLTTWDNLTLGFVDPTKWQLPKELLTSDEDYTFQVKTMYESAIEKIKVAGGAVHYPVPLVHPSTLQFEGQPGYLTILLSEVRDSVNAYLNTLISSPVKSLQDIIQFNKEHPELQAGIDQTYLIQCQENNMSPEVANEARIAMKKAAGEDGIDKILNEFGLDVIVTPMDSPISTVTALAGYPSATVPLGYLEPSGRPVGLCLVAKANEEGKLLRVMSAYEATMPGRRLPTRLIQEN